MARVVPLLLAVLLTSAAPAAAKSRCAVPRSTTVQQNQHVRVYSLVTGEREAYACSRSSGRRVYMGVMAGDVEWDVRHITLVGRRLAWVQTECSSREGCATDDLVVAHMARRPTVVRIADPGGVFDVALTPHGAVAWTTVAFDEGYSLWKSDLAGTAELAHGPDLDRRSLAAADARVYWTQAGKPHSTVLTGAARP